MSTFPFAVANNPSQAGRLASSRALFGDASRFSTAAVHTRFDDVAWFVWDAETPDELTGLASVIRQFTTREEAQAFAALA